MDAFKALHLALSALSCSISRTGRQLSNCCAEAFRYDKNCRHRGSDERDSLLRLERQAAAGYGLDEAEPIAAGPGALGQGRRHHGGGVAALIPQAPPCALRNSLQLKGDPIDPP